MSVPKRHWPEAHCFAVVGLEWCQRPGAVPETRDPASSLFPLTLWRTVRDHWDFENSAAGYRIRPGGRTGAAFASPLNLRYRETAAQGQY